MHYRSHKGDPPHHGPTWYQGHGPANRWRVTRRPGYWLAKPPYGRHYDLTECGIFAPNQWQAAYAWAHYNAPDDWECTDYESLGICPCQAITYTHEYTDHERIAVP